MRKFALIVGLLGLAGAACGKEEPLPPPSCDNYEFRGEIFNCSLLDRCTEEDFTYRLACCECDPALCSPDPTCPPEKPPETQASSCMSCHNGASREDYSGLGISNPHPFAGSTYLSCTQCHGGNGEGRGKKQSHVPPPPEIGDRLQQQNDPFAHFNRVTLTGLDKLNDYEVDGQTFSPLDYIQFINPGDLRVVSAGKSCGAGGCHGEAHVDWVTRNPIATAAGIVSAPLYGAGILNDNPDYRGWYQDTAADYGFRAVVDPTFINQESDQEIGRVGALAQFPQNARYGDVEGIFQNPLYDATLLSTYVFTESQSGHHKNQIISGSPLDTLLKEAIAITCGNCHLGSAGNNNRYADYRSSGCTACHMEYSFDGKSRSLDSNVPKTEPADPDSLAPGERPHIEDHQIRNVAKILPGGAFLRGISDKVCVGCHQGSNHTVLQYWGVRLDQNQDLAQNTQYPANPVSFTNTAGDTRLYDPAVGNRTFNGRNADQYILFEDYDGDGRDDTPPDIHYERGLGCVDCHGSRDVHGGTDGDEQSGRIMSRQEQALAIGCESCHGGPDEYAQTTTCIDYDGRSAECPTDLAGNPLRNVTVDESGDYWLRGRIDGRLHYIPQTKDTIVQNNKRHPLTGQLVYNPAASYAMGRADGDFRTGTGPLQGDPDLVSPGFSHSDKMDCASCHAAWTNTCIGCHLAPGYDAGPQNHFFSNITGERIALKQTAADSTYITPLPFFLGVGSRGRITQFAPGINLFFRYDADLNGHTSDVFAFTDRNGNGNNPGHQGRGRLTAVSYNQAMPHSQRGRISAGEEGPRYCVACHLNSEQMQNFGTAYTQFYADMQNGNLDGIDFTLLQQHIGQNTGNQLNSPFWVHMVAGLGSGLFLFDRDGCPVNPLDARADRAYCRTGAPADRFDLNSAVYSLDRVVENTGVANASSSHPIMEGNASDDRAGALNPSLTGPLGSSLLNKLANPDPQQGGLILDGWLDADGQPQGTAADFVN